MQQLYRTSIASPIGPLTLVANNNALVAIQWSTGTSSDSISSTSSTGSTFTTKKQEQQKVNKIPSSSTTTIIDITNNNNNNEHPILLQTEKELNEYFNNERMSFTIPIDLLLDNDTTTCSSSSTSTNTCSNTIISEFQKNVLIALCTIPYGTTCSYKDIAIQINKPKSYRAVGIANSNNPLPIIIPCHRVIKSNGQLSGYNGGLYIKEYLLNLEQKTNNKQQNRTATKQQNKTIN